MLKNTKKACFLDVREETRLLATPAALPSRGVVKQPTTVRTFPLKAVLRQEKERLEAENQRLEALREREASIHFASETMRVCRETFAVKTAVE